MPTSTAALIVVAAGEGRRLGAATRKAFVDLGGRPLVEVTLARLLAADLDPVVLVGHRDDRPLLAALAARLPRPVRLAEGGARRQDSVAAGLDALGPEGPDIVLVHDAARPFVPLDSLPALVEGAARHGCAILAVPVADTLKQARDDAPHLAAGTVPRAGLWAAQTPQAFRRAELQQRLAEAHARGLHVTDEARLFEAAGLSVAFVEGSARNFKVTTPDDLHLARALAALAPEAD